MVNFWYAKVKTRFNGTTLADVPQKYYYAVLALLVADGLYDENGNYIGG